MDGGGGAPYDPCECIFSHEGAMRRLISLLRGSQSYCNEEQCFTDAPNIQASNNDGGMTMMYVMMAWIIAAILLYLLRPASMRGGSEKPTPGNTDRQDPPPAPTA